MRVKIPMLCILLIVFAFFLINHRRPSETDYKLYSNARQGFEIKVPPSSEITDDGDYVDEYGARYQGSFNFSNSYLSIRKNMLTEVTPLIPGPPVCFERVATTTLFETQEFPARVIYTSIGNDDSDCRPASSHTVYVNFCVSSSSKAYDYKLERYSEYTYTCQNNDPFYDIELVCEGPEWAGKKGQDKCVELFNQIMATFKILKQ